MLPLQNAFEDLFRLFYPVKCASCGDDLPERKDIICIDCYAALPHTGFECIANNPTHHIFTGRMKVSAAHSEFYFEKGKSIQRLVHALKYKGRKDIGLMLGKITAVSLLKNNQYDNIDVIIPVPMTKVKIKKRGYNQAAVIAEGMSEVLKVPVNNNVLVKSKKTSTQTKKHRTERWLNIDGSFEINNHDELINKNILLVDDVITTGASLEACGHCLLAVKGVNLFVATVARTDKS